MGQQQFEQLQSDVVMLTAEQLKALQDQIETELLKEQSPLLTEEELTLISSLFR
ncbi:hypothetical protein MACH09_42690 [Vibrio sp. MACH09]|uniref:hypothetical protein n=1 Tax=unclassified Vibrio TaxID=2614977 RepID=UPI0014939065|nr:MULTISPECIES: hypothetical protein [unclassified Vibrio]GLO63761.1 hypothetical protein MACH09_42690 [Vibrio sp. MACH09]